MKSRSLLIPAILAATAVLGLSSNAFADSTEAQAPSSPKAAEHERLGDHPAVLVARQWSTRGIDPNQFIVAHPARLQLLAASPSSKEAQGAKSVASATLVSP